MEIKERLSLYLEFKHISKSDFGRTIGVSSAFVTSIKKSISPDKLQTISLNFPDLNIQWLIFGDGDMIRNTTNSTKSNDSIASLIIELSEQRKVIQKFQEQIDKLLIIIEKLSDK